MNPEPRLVPVDALRTFCESALLKSGLCPRKTWHRRPMCELGTDTMGIYTHGTKSLRGYVKRLRAGGLKAAVIPEITNEGPA